MPRYSANEEAKRAELIQKIKARQELEHRAIDERCSKDPMYWLRNWTATYDPKAKLEGVNPTRPFPDFEYMDWLMYFLFRVKEYPRIFIPKTREMLTSWLLAGCAAHLAQYMPFAQIIAQSEKEDKSVKLVGYSKTLYDQQPEWLRKMHPLKGGYIKTRPGKDKELEIHYENGAEIIGIASGANQIPSYHPTLVILDEGALWAEAAMSYQLAHPVAAQIVVVSTARPGWFQEESDQDGIDQKATEEFIAKMSGVRVRAEGPGSSQSSSLA